MRVIWVAGCVLVLGVAAFSLLDMSALAQWATERQRDFQNAMASSVRGLRAGEPGAWAGLLFAAAAYGFVHAVGPGHGKYLIGGVGLGSTVSAKRLMSIALISSLAQSLWAIVLVYGGLTVLTYTAHELTALAENVLAPISYAAVGAVGCVLLWRGARTLVSLHRTNDQHHHHDHDHDHDHACCGGHGPSPEAVAKAHSLKDSLMLIASVAVRPCTGGIFLLIITWHMDIRAAGAVAVIVMGFGTAGLTSLVAVSSVVARGIALVATRGGGTAVTVAAAMQAVAGIGVIWISALLFSFAVRV